MRKWPKERKIAKMLKLIKKQSKKTYKNNKGEEKHYYNFFLRTDEGKEIAIRACFPDKDNHVLDFLSEYVKK